METLIPAGNGYHKNILTSSLPLALLLSSAIGGLLYLVGVRWAQEHQNMQSISVQGEATIFAEPNLAELSLGVQTGRKQTAQIAMQELQEHMRGVLVAVKALDVKDKDIRTESLWLNPAYDWVEGKQIPRGFEAGQSVTVRLRELSKVGTVLSRAAEAGANQSGGVQFRIEDYQTLRMQAREKAIARAKQEANELAEQLGVELGEIVGFGESGSNAPEPIRGKGGMMDGYGGGGNDVLAVPAGEHEISVQVYLTYRLL